MINKKRRFGAENAPKRLCCIVKMDNIHYIRVDI